MKKSQSGFTLVEIAIVLVIIGLLLGGVLKGQAMVESAKVKALSNDFKAVQSMLFAYQDRFRALPGDDPAAVAHGMTTQATAATAGGGTIDTGTWVGAAAVAAANESSVFWEHVRMAKLATGSATVGQGTNSLGGLLGITSNALRVTTPVGVTGTYFICASGIPGTIAQQLDTAMDDGVGTTGSMFAAVGAAPIVVATPAAPYVAASTYTVCMAI